MTRAISCALSKIARTLWRTRTGTKPDKIAQAPEDAPEREPAGSDYLSVWKGEQDDPPCLSA
jgi:hypothetical protein